MADTPQDEAAQARIIKHMNADHADSLSLYLQHFHKLSPRTADGASISSISLSSMTLKTTNGNSYKIPFNPAMKSFSEARQRSVELDREARNGLGLSTIQITEYEPPRQPAQVILFGVLSFTWLAIIFQRQIVPGSLAHDAVAAVFPGGAEMFVSIVRKLTVPFVGIHVVESVLFDRLKLSKHGVKRGSGLWWMWIGSTLIEGFGCFKRINETIDRKTKELEKAKH
ncbi:related to integral membrane protein [Rhynchosporium agropyri]|uniref:Related to integral membrane protein n=1 Tax=Rhynchosporium agropyri TaxID=914238 RepID=A0A1E1LQS1_9HELO|nr:related to integral membrane protein [Rhynchosporium agropyri]